MSKEILWAINGDTGLSSLTIWGVMMGVKIPTDHVWRYSPPRDTSDFGRCYKLLQLMPEWRERLHEVSDQLPDWKPYVDEWGKLTALWAKGARTGNLMPLCNRLAALKDKSRIIYQSDQQGVGLEIEMSRNP